MRPVFRATPPAVSCTLLRAVMLAGSRTAVLGWAFGARSFVSSARAMMRVLPRALRGARAFVG
jgi:hypothetical protein